MKKAKKAARKQEEEKVENTKDATKKDDDPKGEMLVKTDKPLDEAVRFLARWK